MNRPRRPLLYLCTDPGIPVFGKKGCSTHVREMARAMADLGEDVWLATAGPIERVPEGFPCRMIRLPALNGRLGRWMGFDARQWLIARAAIHPILHLAKRIQPFAIYERYSLYGTAGLRLERRLQIPRFLEINALLSDEAVTRLHLPALARLMEKHLVRTAPGISAISDTMKTRLKIDWGLPDDRIMVSPMGVDPRRFNPSVSPAAAKACLDSERPAVKGPRIGYFGSFNHYHRPAWLLDLAEGLIRRGMAAQFVVIGGPDWKVNRHREEARRRRLDHLFHYCGQIEHEELPPWIAALDLAVVPGAAPQSSPTKIVEAAAVGVPQIVPDYPTIRDLLGRLGPWAFFPPDDREAFAERVAQALGRLESIRREAQDLAPWVAECHSWQKRAADTLGRLRGQLTPAREPARPQAAAC